MFDILDLLKIDSHLDKIKVHFATAPADTYKPLREFESGRFQKWQEWQTKNNFTKPYILSLIYYKPSVWIFAGIYEVHSKIKVSENHYDFNTSLSPISEKLIGRLLIFYDKKFRNSYPHAKTIIADLKFHSIIPESRGIRVFPGIRNINITYSDLKSIITNNNEEWKAGLSGLKAIYLITDTNSGKMYVGSATGNQNVWDRWKSYSISGHGGNKLLKELLEFKGKDYVNYFKFSILEVFGDESSGLDVVRKENLWKEKLLTRAFGYNDN